MARGFPDYFGQSIFLKYGSLQEEDDNGTIDDGAKTAILSVDGKGKTYGGMLYWFGDASVYQDAIFVDVDGVEVGGGSPAGGLVYNNHLCDNRIITLSSLKADLLRASVLIAKDITFEENITIYMDPFSADDRDWYIRLTWAKVI